MTPTIDPTAAGDPLAALRGLHLPEPVGFWPPAPGWWIAAGLLVASAVGVWLWRRARRRSVARHALRELDALAVRSGTEDLQALATAVSELLRRLALVRFGRARVAALHGRAWQSFLSETAPRSRRARFDADAGLLLSLAPYAPAGAECLTLAGATLDRAGLLAAARAWIKENA
ncbi:MAG TPA: DUF4381 domain-containing protein [Candidatus Binatia bacterium]